MADPGLLAEPGSPEAALLAEIDRSRLPLHVAVIMDGNGRWAEQRGLPRIEGHRAGVTAVRDVVESAARLGIGHLTLYAFSVENWKRPKAEVWTLMNLLKEFVRREQATLVRNDIRFEPIGRWRELDPSVVAALERAVAVTRDCRGMRFNIALNYSGRCEIVDACRKIVGDWAAGKPVEIDEATLSGSLYTAGQPDPDLLVRTSGELRVSNFLLWQIAYAEIWVTPVYWPDFRRRHLFESIVEFQRRVRRFGGVEASADGRSAASAAAPARERAEPA
jgi:undecaprenyl diphosphate synthase